MEEIVNVEESKKVRRTKAEEVKSSKFLKILNEHGNVCWLNLETIVFISNPSEGVYSLHCTDSNAYNITDRSVIAHLID